MSLSDITYHIVVKGLVDLFDIHGCAFTLALPALYSHDNAFALSFTLALTL
jgi:hypothetical protein